MGVKDYKELEVYRLAFEAAGEIFEISKKFPPEERYSLTDQIRRTTRSTCANIAEAWRKRRYQAAFVSKLSDADAEAAETVVWLDFALQCGYIQEATHKKLIDKYDHICRQLSVMMKNSASWCSSYSSLHAERSTLHAPRASGGAPRSTLHAPRSSPGIALIMSLGVLSVMVIMAVAFSVSMRTERLAAGNYADSVRARQLVQTGLVRALNDLANQLGTNGLKVNALSIGGTNYPTWTVANSSANTSINTSARLYLLYSASASPPANSATNFVPRALWVAATNADQSGAANHWLAVDSVVYTNYSTNIYLAASNRLGAVKYLIINCSGLLDANFVGGHPQGRSLGTNPTEIAITNLPEFDAPSDAANFLANRVGDYRYETLEELRALNLSAFNNTTPPNFTVYSHAPAGYWTNNTVSNLVNLAGDASQLAARRLQITDAFVGMGFTGSQTNLLYSNLIDYVDSDSIPTNSAIGTVERVPMISRIVFSSVFNDPNYDVTVTFRLWYPFVAGGGQTFKFDASVKIGAEIFVVPTTDVTTTNKSLSVPLPSTPRMLPPGGPYALEITSATVKDSAGINIVDTLNPNTTLPGVTYTFGDPPVSWECIDPRFNYDPAGATWELLGANIDVGPINGVTTNYWGNNPGVDRDSDMYVANGALQSVGELGYLAYAPWRTIKLYGANVHPIFNAFAISTNAGDIYTTNLVYRGRVNPNTRQVDVLSAVFTNMPIDEYPGQVGAVKLETPAEIQAIVNDIQTEFYTNVSQVGRYFTDPSFPAAADNELKRESIFRNTAGLFSTRQNLFTIIIEGQVGLGGNIPDNPIRQRAVALVWRDPYTGEMFVRSIKWLRD